MMEREIQMSIIRKQKEMSWRKREKQHAYLNVKTRSERQEWQVKEMDVIMIGFKTHEIMRENKLEMQMRMG